MITTSGTSGTSKMDTPKFKLGDKVKKIKGSEWKGIVVGTYSTTLTPEGYAVESSTEKGSVQIYPAAALQLQSQVILYEKEKEEFFYTVQDAKAYLELKYDINLIERRVEGNVTLLLDDEFEVLIDVCYNAQ